MRAAVRIGLSALALVAPSLAAGTAGGATDEPADRAVGLPEATPQKLALAKTLVRLTDIEDALKASIDARRRAEEWQHRVVGDAIEAFRKTYGSPAPSSDDRRNKS